MASISDMIGYICENYPHKGDLSKARLTKMVYLADWKSSIETGDQISRIKWKFNHYGPYVDDVVNAARNDPSFSVDLETNLYGDQKETISLSKPREWSSLTPSDKKWLTHVMEETKKLYWKDFIQLVYSTFPVMVSERQNALDLPKLAARYKSEVQSRL